MIRSFNGMTPKIADTSFVSEAAYVVGDVEIGEHSSVWPGAVIRGDFGKIKIGNEVAVEDGAVIHSGTTSTQLQDMIIGDNVHIGHHAVINCRKIGSNVLIGMNATLLHNAEIGDYCIIGAGCLVNQGMTVPDKSFVVGVPGRVKGEVGEKQLWWVKEGSAAYVDLARQYKEQGL